MSVLLLTMGPQLGITADLPVVGVGGAGVIRFRPVGAAGPVKWTLVDSTLPAEWDSALNPDGNAVTLTTSDAETAGTFSVTVRAVDSARIPVVRSFDVRVMALPLTISGAFPEWITGLPATGALSISGGVPPYSGLAITSGALPSGVSLSIVGNQIVASGSPTVAGPWAATLRASDSAETTSEISVTGTVARLWTPADLPVAPKVWLDWDSALTEVSGNVSEWYNRGSLSGAFSQTAPSSRPLLLNAELNGKRALSFSGSSQYLSGPVGIARGTSQSIVMAVVRPQVQTGAGCFLGVNAPVGARGRINAGYGYPTSTSTYLASSRRNSIDSEQIVSASLPANEWSLVSWRADFTGNALGIAVNAHSETIVPAWSGSFTTDSNDDSPPARIGGYPTGGNFLKGEIVMVLCIDGALSFADRQRTEGWAAWQCGLQASLPIGHPYKSNPPVVSP